MFTFEEIYKAYLRCRKGKRNTINALKFEQNLCENLCDLETLLNSKAYTPSRSICFITTSPKLREVFAADFKDRVVHHLVVPLLEQLYEPKFIYDSYSSRINKGIHKAVLRSKKFSVATKYYLQIDIKNFFYTIDKKILFNKLNQMIVKNYNRVKNTNINAEEMLRIVYQIIFHDCTKDALIKGGLDSMKNIPAHKSLFTVDKSKGLPIGNLTSQFFANVYLNDLDNYAKRVLKCKRYIRYVDDVVIFDDSKKRLFEIQNEIKQYLQENLYLELRDKFIVRDIKDGLDFLGYIIRPKYTLVRKRVVNNFKSKKARYLQRYEDKRGKMSLEEINQFLFVQASFVGHIKHANSYNLQKKVGVLDESNPFDYDRA